MKKNYLFILIILGVFNNIMAQTNLVLTAPINNATTQNRAPNGTDAHTFMRGATIATTTELSSIPSGTNLTTFGFTTTVGAATAVTGTLIVYMQNTTSNTYTLGTTWASIISGMTQVYSGNYTVPANATSVDLTLTTPFNYTGGSVFVAYDFIRTGTAATTAATYAANNALAASCVTGNNATAAPATLASTAFRPSMRFGYVNPNNNDMAIEGIRSLGNIATAISQTAPVSAYVTNKSNTTLNNINVTATITGANNYTDSQTIASLAAGASTTVNFANFTPTALGANVLTVSVPADQVNTNNSLTFNSLATCFNSGAAQNPVTFTESIGFNTGSGIISTRIQNTNATTIEGVKIAIANNTQSVGNNVFGVIQDNAGVILAKVQM
jgi:hypothetical protein